jgi:hypothetical protein
VFSLKRLLLTQLQVKEFSDDSQFRDPSLTYLLRDIICKYCNTSRDIDLLRDEVLCDPDRPKDARWVCTNCHHGLNALEAENRYLPYKLRFLNSQSNL